MKNTLLAMVLGLSLAITLGVNANLVGAQLSGCDNYILTPAENVINSTWLISPGALQPETTFIDCDGVEISRLNHSSAWGDANLTIALMPPVGYTECYLNINCASGAPLNNPRDVYAMYSDFDYGNLDGWDYFPLDGKVTADITQSHSKEYSMKYDQNETTTSSAFIEVKNKNPNYFGVWANLSANGDTDSYFNYIFCASEANFNDTECGQAISIYISKWQNTLTYNDHKTNLQTCGTVAWTDDKYHLIELYNINKTRGFYGYFQIWADGAFLCEAEFYNATFSDTMAGIMITPDRTRIRTFWNDDFMAAYFVSVNASVPPPHIPPTLPKSAEAFCANNNTLFSREYGIADNGSAVLSDRYEKCSYGCLNSTITGLGAAGCAETPLQSALLFMVALVGVIAVLAWLDKR